jgi:hypothetical protein
VEHLVFATIRLDADQNDTNPECLKLRTPGRGWLHLRKKCNIKLRGIYREQKKEFFMSTKWIMLFLCIFLAAECAKDEALKLDYDTFDQRPGMGWRQLAEKGRFLDAAMLIDRYVEKYKDLDESQQQGEAQLAGSNTKAAAYRGVQILCRPDRL